MNRTRMNGGRGAGIGDQGSGEIKSKGQSRFGVGENADANV